MRLSNLFRRKSSKVMPADSSRWENEDWVAALNDPDPSTGLEALRDELVKGLRIVLKKRTSRVSDEDVDDFVQDALVRITSNLDSFRGDSRFLTWAQKIAVRVAFSSMRRKRWQDVSLEAVAEQSNSEEPFAGALADPALAPDEVTGRKMVIDMLHAMMHKELTERQQLVLRAVALEGMPMEEVARQMGTNRNALYKMMHDARKRLKSAMEAHEMNLSDMMGGDE